MPDREKAIKGLTDIEQIMICRQEICPQEEQQYWIELQESVADALELLKQEAVEPDTDSEGTCTCGNCGEAVGYYPVGCNTPQKLCKFCPTCGRSVKWE